MKEPTVKKTLRERCKLTPKAAGYLDMLMTRQLTRTARYHNLSLEEMENLATNISDDYAFAACMLLLRPGIRNKFRKNIREQMLPRLPLYTNEWVHGEERPKFRTPISPKQIDAVLQAHELDYQMYVTLFHMLSWHMVTDIVEQLPSVAVAGDEVRQRNYNDVVERNSGYNRNERY